MFKLILRINESDIYPIILMPHQNRDLKKNEYLLFEADNKKECEKRLKDLVKNLIRIDGEVKNYK